MTDPDNAAKKWFAPKRYGYGAGLPVTWQGWAVTLAVLAAFVVIVTVFDGASKVAALIALTMIIIAVAAPRTRGGWRWRWGGRD